ncbi:MAG: hypothetical protein K0R14_1251 [Burkholderiales bacterium]|jgi:hypothetical protein|nr:hypothetical protein [Burkholderiales bacterium]
MNKKMFLLIGALLGMTIAANAEEAVPQNPQAAMDHGWNVNPAELGASGTVYSKPKVLISGTPGVDVGNSTKIWVKNPKITALYKFSDSDNKQKLVEATKEFDQDIVIDKNDGWNKKGTPSMRAMAANTKSFAEASLAPEASTENHEKKGFVEYDCDSKVISRKNIRCNWQ